MKNILRVEVDTTDEICKQFNRVIDNLNLVEGKVLQLDAQSRRLASKSWVSKLLKPKKQKEGFAMFKTLIITALMALLLFAVTAQGAWEINYDNCSNPENLVRLLRDRFANQTAATYTFTPGTEPSSTDTTEGMVYYKDSSDTLQLRTESAWVDIDVAGASSLDAAYTIGQAIGVDAGAMTLTGTDATGNVLLALDQEDTDSTVAALTVTSTGDAAAIIMAQSGSGTDIQFSDGGSISKVSAIVVEGGITDLTDGTAILMDTNEEIQFGDSEDISFNFATNNTVTLATDTDVATFAFGVVDDLSGVGNIAFDTAAGGISLAGTTDTWDLTIAQTGTVDSSLILTSAGSVSDALSLITTDGVGSISLVSADNITRTAADDITDVTTAGGYTVTVGDATLGKYIMTAADTASMTSVDSFDIATSAAGSDIDVDAAAGSIIIDGGEAIATAVVITATGLAGGIDITSLGDIDITTTGASDEDISLINTGGSVELSASEVATDAINIDATAGGIDIDAVGASGLDIAITNTGGSILIAATESAVDSIVLQSTLGGIDILCDAATSEDIDISNSGGSVHIVATEAATDSVNVDAVGVDIDASGNIDLTSTANAADSIMLQSTLGGIDILCDASDTENIDISNTGGSVYITSSEAADGAITLTTGNAAGQILLVCADTTTDAIEIDNSGGMDIACADDVSLVLTTSTDSEDLLIQVDGDDDSSIILDSDGTAADAIKINANTAGGIDMDFGATGFSLVGASGDIAITAAGDVGDVITITNTTSTATAAIALVATAGGLDVDVKKSAIITSTADAAAAVVIQSTLGGIDIQCDSSDDESLDISNAGGPIVISTTHDATPSLTITTSDNAGQILIDSGDLTIDGLNIDSAGGIDIDGADDIDIQVNSTATGDDLNLIQDGAQDAHVLISATGTSIDAIKIHSNGGVGAGILLHQDAGTAITDGAASIQLLSDVGGIDLTATGATDTGAINLNAAAGGITAACVKDFALTVTSATTGDDMTFTQAGTATDSHISFVLNGTSDDAFGIAASAGGIDIDAATDIIHIQNAADGDADDITIALTGATNSSIELASAGSSTDAIYLHENGAGTAGCIKIHADTGTAVADGAASVQLLSDLGGIGLKATGVASTDAIALDANAGGITMACVKDFAISVTSAAGDDDITLQTVGNADSHIILLADGSTNDALTLTADLGGIDIDAVELITIDLAGGTAATSDIIITNTTGDDAAAIELTATAGGVAINATAAAGKGILTLNSLIGLSPALTLADNATPDISGGSFFETGAATTYTGFDVDTGTVVEGTIIVIKSLHAAVFDVTTTTIEGGTTDITTASGDVTTLIYDGASKWRVIAYMDMAEDLN